MCAFHNKYSCNNKYFNIGSNKIYWILEINEEIFFTMKLKERCLYRKFKETWLELGKGISELRTRFLGLRSFGLYAWMSISGLGTLW